MKCIKCFISGDASSDFQVHNRHSFLSDSIVSCVEEIAKHPVGIRKKIRAWERGNDELSVGVDPVDVWKPGVNPGQVGIAWGPFSGSRFPFHYFVLLLFSLHPVHPFPHLFSSYLAPPKFFFFNPIKGAVQDFALPFHPNTWRLDFESIEQRPNKCMQRYTSMGLLYY